MENLRYGRFRFRDYYASWVGISVLLLFAFAGMILNLSYLYVFFSILYAVIWLWTICAPNLERFTIKDDRIIVRKGRISQEISIPLDSCLIISYADICPPLAMRTAFGNKTHILKDRLAVSILHQMPLESVLKNLHRNYIQKYTTSTIKAFFDEYLYVYSFVCNQALLDQLLSNRNCQLIIPESLLERLSIDQNTVNVHIDTGY